MQDIETLGKEMKKDGVTKKKTKMSQSWYKVSQCSLIKAPIMIKKNYYVER